MQLFLSSYRFGNFGELYQDMIGNETTVGVITNAKDSKTDGERAESVRALLDSFGELNIKTHEIDLRPFFDQPDLTRLELDKYDAVWVAGGNTFVLLRALRASGADVVLRENVRDGRTIYGGESAGAIVAAPSLMGVEFADDPDVLPEGYPDQDVWDGLALVSYCIVPHYESGDEAIDRMVDVLEEAGMPYKTLDDSQAIVVTDDESLVQ